MSTFNNPKQPMTQATHHDELVRSFREGGASIPPLDNVVELAARPDRVVLYCQGTKGIFVLKASKNGSKAQAEWAAEARFAAAGIACEPRSPLVQVRGWHVYWTDFCEGFPLYDEFQRTNTIGLHNLDTLGRSLRILYSDHWQDIPADLHGKGSKELLIDRLQRWRTDLRTTVSIHGLQEVGDILFLRLEAQDIPSAPSFVHGDVTMRNSLILGDRTVMIDFEHCTYGDPLFDISKFFVDFPSVAAIAERLVHQALGSHVPRNWSDLLDLYVQIHRFGVAIWTARHSPTRALWQPYSDALLRN